MIKIYIRDENRFFNSSEKRLIKKHILKLLKNLSVQKDTELSVSFINDVEMRTLNSKYRDINRTTDVLSFPQNGADSSILGDVIISVDTAKRRARMYQIDTWEEIYKLIIHGILHLLGYNHKKRQEAVTMREKETELLSFIKAL